MQDLTFWRRIEPADYRANLFTLQMLGSFASRTMISEGATRTGAGYQSQRHLSRHSKSAQLPRASSRKKSLCGACLWSWRCRDRYALEAGMSDKLAFYKRYGGGMDFADPGVGMGRALSHNRVGGFAIGKTSLCRSGNLSRSVTAPDWIPYGFL